MKNITFSADEQLIDRARERAAREHTNLNSVFRRWLRFYAGSQAADYDALMDELSHVSAGKKFNRDEMNER